MCRNHIVIERVWISKLWRCLTWKLRRPEKAVAWVKRWVTTLVFANWAVLALEEAFLSLCQSSRAIISDRCFCYFMPAMFVSLRRTQTWRLHTSSINLGDNSANNPPMKNSRDLILSKVVYISIIYRISDSWLFSLNGYNCYFDHVTGENREYIKY